MTQITKFADCKTGMNVKAKIMTENGTQQWISGVLHVTPNKIFLCHNCNHAVGNPSPDMHGMKYSWQISVGKKLIIPNNYFNVYEIIEMPVQPLKNITKLEQCVTGMKVVAKLWDSNSKYHNVSGILQVSGQLVWICHNNENFRGRESSDLHGMNYSWQIMGRGVNNQTIPNNLWSIKKLTEITKLPKTTAKPVKKFNIPQILCPQKGKIMHKKSTKENLVPITTFDQCKTGMKVGAKIGYRYTVNVIGVLHVQGDNVWICHNKPQGEGDPSPNMHGMKYSWRVMAKNIPDKSTIPNISCKAMVGENAQPAKQINPKQITNFTQCKTGMYANFTQCKTGMYVGAKFSGGCLPKDKIILAYGVLHVDTEGNVFLCHNNPEVNGSPSPDLHGFKYGWKIIDNRSYQTIPNFMCREVFAAVNIIDPRATYIKENKENIPKMIKITKITELFQCKTGMRVTARLPIPTVQMPLVVNGILHVDLFNVYLCHDCKEADGFVSPDMHGMKYSWRIMTEDVTSKQSFIPNERCMELYYEDYSML